MHEKRS